VTPFDTTVLRTVLLVEDDELLLLASLDLLASGGFQVVVARDGREAWDLFEAEPRRFDLVLMDMGLPRMDGFELFQKIRALRSDLAVIFTTGYIQKARKAEVVAAGAATVILKPYTGEELLRAVGELLDGSARISA
jgi:CheY-like chemotaxis protein